MAFGKLMGPDENTIKAVYLGPQQHTSLLHTKWLLGNSTLWRPGIGGGLWINGESTTVSTYCPGQAAAHRYSRTKKILKNENLNTLGPTPRLRRNICCKLERFGGRNGNERCGGFTSVCLCGRRSSSSSRLLKLISPAVFHALSLLQQNAHIYLYFTNLLHITPEFELPFWSNHKHAMSCLDKTQFG